MLGQCVLRSWDGPMYGKECMVRSGDERAGPMYGKVWV